MKRIGRVLAACAFAGFLPAAIAGEAATNATVCLTLELSDGSRVVGIPTMTSVAVRTAYAKMNVPLGQIRSIRMESDRETASFAMANGDRLQGVYDMGPVEMDTVFGKVKVDVGLVRNMRIRRSFPGGLPPDLRASLVLHYTFDQEGAGVRDETGKTGAGAVNGATWTSEGKSGGAFAFDGRQSYLTTPSVDSTGDATWSVWIYPRSFPAANDTYAQFLGARGHAWVWNSDNTSISFACQNAYGGTRLALQFFVMGPDERTYGYTHHVFPVRPEPHRWYHVAGVLDASGTHLYVDGKLLCESAHKTKLAAPCPLIIGANDNGPQRYFDGLIDEVMIFRKAFSSEEIETLFSSQQ